MKLRTPALAVLLISGCDPNVCPVGQIRSGETCVDYHPSDPVQADVWTPDPGTTWQWQITGRIKTAYDVEMYDLDLFDLTDEAVQALQDEDRILICYFSAGSFEPWKDDADRFPEETIGRRLDGWPDERWLNHTDPRVREIMLDRLDRAVEAGCDGVEPDNVTAYHNNTGFGINATEQLDYNRFLADEAHKRGLSVGLKNDIEQGSQLLDWFDWTLNEECLAFHECGRLAPFVDAGKAVFHVEYVDRWADAGALAREVCGIRGFSSLIKGWDLGPEFRPCP